MPPMGQPSIGCPVHPAVITCPVTECTRASLPSFHLSLCTQHPFGSLSPYGHELIPLLQSMADNGGELSAEKYAEVSGWPRGSQRMRGTEHRIRAKCTGRDTILTFACWPCVQALGSGPGA